MFIYANSKKSMPEVEVSGTLDEFRKLSNTLSKKFETYEIESADRISRYYPRRLKSIIFKQNPGDSNRLVITLNESLIISSTSKGMSNLAESIINIFDADAELGDHFHLDFFEGNQLLEPTNISIVFILEDGQ